MSADLVLAGIFQGYWWAALLPWDVSIAGSRPFWIVRLFAGLAMAAGLVCFLVNIVWTARLAARRPEVTAA